MPVPSQDHCGYQLSGGVIPILPYVLWTLACSVIVLYTLFKEEGIKDNLIYLDDSYNFLKEKNKPTDKSLDLSNFVR